MDDIAAYRLKSGFGDLVNMTIKESQRVDYLNLRVEVLTREVEQARKHFSDAVAYFDELIPGFRNGLSAHMTMRELNK